MRQLPPLLDTCAAPYGVRKTQGQTGRTTGDIFKEGEGSHGRRGSSRSRPFCPLCSSLALVTPTEADLTPPRPPPPPPPRPPNPKRLRGRSAAATLPTASPCRSARRPPSGWSWPTTSGWLWGFSAPSRSAASSSGSTEPWEGRRWKPGNPLQTLKPPLSFFLSPILPPLPSSSLPPFLPSAPPYPLPSAPIVPFQLCSPGLSLPLCPCPPPLLPRLRRLSCCPPPPPSTARGDIWVAGRSRLDRCAGGRVLSVQGPSQTPPTSRPATSRCVAYLVASPVEGGDTSGLPCAQGSAPPSWKRRRRGGGVFGSEGPGGVYGRHSL